VIAIDASATKFTKRQSHEEHDDHEACGHEAHERLATKGTTITKHVATKLTSV